MEIEDGLFDFLVSTLDHHNEFGSLPTLRQRLKDSRLWLSFRKFSSTQKVPKSNLESSENGVVPAMVPETLHQLASILRDPLLRRIVYEWDSLPHFAKQAIAGLLDGVSDRK